jgi:hypothetical protein
MTYFGSFEPPGKAKKKEVVSKVGRSRKILVFPRNKPKAFDFGKDEYYYLVLESDEPLSFMG